MGQELYQLLEVYVKTTEKIGYGSTHSQKVEDMRKRRKGDGE